MARIRLRVKEIAEEKGLNMSRLAHNADVSFTTVKGFFRDPYRPFHSDTLQRLADALGVSIFDLIEEVPNEEKTETP